MSRDEATHDVFISHSSQDQAVAEAAREAIEGAGHRCWIAPRDIVPGEKYGEAIVNGIQASRIFLLIVSARSVASHQVERETERAANAGLAIIPFRIEDVKPSKSLEFFISSAHWLDAFEPPMDRHYDYLTEVVGQLLAAKKGEAGPPAHRAVPPPKRTIPGGRRFRRGPAVALAGLLAAALIGGALYWGLSGRLTAGSCVEGDYVQRATTGDESKPLNLRAGPSLEARIVAVIRANETFCVATQQGEWWRARRGTGEVGYVLGRRISLIVRQGEPGANQQQPATGNGAAAPQENKQ